MYKLTKPKGYTSVVTITETESYASIDLGTPSITMLDILVSAGVLDETDSSKAFNEWNFDIEKDVADKLFPLAMRIEKPKRDQRKIKPEETKVNNKNIDALDVLLGLAQYSK